MRILLDNNVHVRFAKLISGHEISHAKDFGWERLRNGELLRAAEQGNFQAVITYDKQMQFQQNLSGRSLSVLVLNSPKITLKDIAPLAPEANIILGAMLFGRCYIIDPSL